MNVVVEHDGTDITNWVISYDREQDICTGVGSLEVIVPQATPRTFHPWDVIEVWENGTKRGKYYVSDLDESAKDGIITLACEDESKRLTDYFITDSYLIDYLSYSKTWIVKFLEEAGITYTITATGEGVPLSNNTNLGFDSAYSTITTLLQQTGWYIYFDEVGTAIIGELVKDVNNPDHSITAADFAEFQRELDDDRLRNRAVVWGNSNPTYGEVFVDISVQTPWNYDANDERAVVIANSSIFSNDQALALAQKLLKEFTQIKDEKYLLAVNDYNMKLGELVKVTSDYWSGRGLITSINATASPDGLVYGITLDQKCPRMFTFYSNYPPTVSGFYVYTGHISDGIWKKQTEGSTWYDDSSGLEPGVRVDDLFIRNGTFATVLDDGYLYTKTVENSPWNKYYHGDLRDTYGNSYAEADLRAVACSVNMSDNVIAGYNYVPSGAVISGFTTVSGLSWVLELTGSQSLVKAEQVVISGGAGDGHKYAVMDLEATGEYNIVTTAGISPVSGYIPEAIYENALFGSGHRDLMYMASDSHWYAYVPPDSDSLALGFGYGDHTPTEFGGTYTQDASGLICDQTTQIYWYAGRDGLVKVDPSDQSSTLYSWADKTEWIGVASSDFWTFLRHKTTNTFDFVVLFEDSYKVYKLYRYTYTLGGSLTDAGNWTLDVSGGGNWFWGAGLSGSDFMFVYKEGVKTMAKVLNLTSGSMDTVTIVDTTNDLPAHNGETISVFISSYGGGLVVGQLTMIGTNLADFASCPFLPAYDKPQTAELWANCYTISKYGSRTIHGPTKIDEWDVHPDSLYFSMGDTGPAILGSWTATGTSTLTQQTHLIMPIVFGQAGCGWVGKKDMYRGLTLGISFPSMSTFHSLYTDWWEISDEWYPDYFSQLVEKPLNFPPRAGPSNFASHYSKYGGTVISIWDIGREIYEVRGLPNYSTIYWRGTGSGATPDTIGLDFYKTVDDFTGQIASHGTAGNYHYMATKGNLDNWNTRSYTPNGTSVWITQHFLTTFGGHYYYFYALPYDQAANFPLGTVLKHTSTPELGTSITASDVAIEQTLGIFEVIKTTDVPCYVDIAKDTPTVIYSLPETLEDNSQEFWASITNTPNSFYTHDVPKPVYEARNFDLPKPGTFPSVSGVFDPKDYERFVGIANQEGILASEYPLNTPWVNMVAVASGVAVSGAVVSGLITHFETSNYAPEGTYFFYTVSGVKTFYQKNPLNNYWTDYSAGLPDSDITIIRVDDVI